MFPLAGSGCNNCTVHIPNLEMRAKKGPDSPLLEYGRTGTIWTHYSCETYRGGLFVDLITAV